MVARLAQWQRLREQPSPFLGNVVLPCSLRRGDLLHRIARLAFPSRSESALAGLSRGSVRPHALALFSSVYVMSQRPNRALQRTASPPSVPASREFASAP